jgi:two-component system chemotaxis response regulator CheB
VENESIAPKSVIAIGAGMGGSEALLKILAPLPADFPAVILVAMHLSPNWAISMVEELNQQTALTVRQAKSGDPVQPGSVFIAPPKYHLVIAEVGVLWLTVGDKINFARPAVDPLFDSVAKIHKERTIGVILTGSDSDGAAGIKAIKQVGGRTIAQDEASSENPEMPRTAVATGYIDLVLPLAEIGPALLKMVQL